MAKIKGTYTQTYAGLSSNGLRSLTGAPVEPINMHKLKDDELWDRIKEADEQQWPMILGTDGSLGDDSKLNSCGVHYNHAYSIVKAFELKR